VRAGAADDRPVVVLGGSLAGYHAAHSLRHHGFDGPLIVVDPDRSMPYRRPPLSKQCLSGKLSFDQLGLGRWPEGAAIQLGISARRLDLDQAQLTLSDSSTLSYSGLVVATGLRARQPEPLFAGAGSGVMSLRDESDCRRLRSPLASKQAILVVGAGFIGTEVAAVATEVGCRVTVVELMPAPLHGVLPPMFGQIIASDLRASGVDLHLEVACQAVEHDSAGRPVVTLTDGQVIAADAVLVAAGGVPNTDWLADSGLALSERGYLKVDERCQVERAATNSPGVSPPVLGCGDVTEFWHPSIRRRLHLEHFDNAVAQGRLAGSTLAGLLDPTTDRNRLDEYRPVPFFWSDQIDGTWQIVGLPAPSDVVQLEEGSFDKRRFVASTTSGGHITGAVLLSMPHRMSHWRQQVAKSWSG
jgi:3-phenylpropionate/trans-cinnamate dioxygenase ferredoxin reductase subunit